MVNRIRTKPAVSIISGWGNSAEQSVLRTAVCDSEGTFACAVQTIQNHRADQSEASHGGHHRFFWKLHHLHGPSENSGWDFFESGQDRKCSF